MIKYFNNYWGGRSDEEPEEWNEEDQDELDDYNQAKEDEAMEDGI